MKEVGLCGDQLDSFHGAGCDLWKDIGFENTRNTLTFKHYRVWLKWVAKVGFSRLNLSDLKGKGWTDWF